MNAACCPVCEARAESAELGHGAGFGSALESGERPRTRPNHPGQGRRNQKAAQPKTGSRIAPGPEPARPQTDREDPDRLVGLCYVILYYATVGSFLKRIRRARARAGRGRPPEERPDRKCVRLQYQFFLVMQAGCKHLYSFLGPYIDSCTDRAPPAARPTSGRPPRPGI